MLLCGTVTGSLVPQISYSRCSWYVYSNKKLRYVRAYMHTYIHTHTYIHLSHTRLYRYVGVCMHVCMYGCMYGWMDGCTHAYAGELDGQIA